MNWWVHLSFSHGAIVLGVIVIAVCILGSALLAPRDEESYERPASPWPIIDYSVKFRDKSKWLGPRHLLANPINRRVG